jgi:hypothetical protein
MILLQDINNFFPCCSVRLCRLINYLYNYNYLDINICNKELFSIYNKKYTEITNEYFETSNGNCIKKQQTDKIFYINIGCFYKNIYKNIDYSIINDYIDNYFKPNKDIIDIYNNLLIKYYIFSENCIGLYFKEDNKTDIYIYEIKLNEILKINKNIQILVISDSLKFINYYKRKNNVIIINENKLNIKELFAIILIISKCKYVICNSTYNSIWIVFYRKYIQNLFQILNNVLL